MRLPACTRIIEGWVEKGKALVASCADVYVKNVILQALTNQDIDTRQLVAGPEGHETRACLVGVGNVESHTINLDQGVIVEALVALEGAG